MGLTANGKRRRRRLPAGIGLIVALVLGVLGWSAKGRDHRTLQAPQPANAATPLPTGFLEGRVVGVSDGDTLTVLDASNTPYKIRLLGIDAPEKAQDFGKVAKQVLSDKVFEKQIRVQVKSKDRYDRTLGKVLLNGEDINLEMLREGLAWHYKHYASSQFPGDAERYAQAETSARDARLGLWGYENPMEPWLWRQDHRRGGRH